jgi:hypothetical protein
MDRINKRFNIKLNKTKNPFNISEFLTKDKIIPFLTGIIDGDGHINKFGYQITIKCHSNWETNFQLISECLFNSFFIESKVSINKLGWMAFVISGKNRCKQFKELSAKNNIPSMSRKWSRINIL